MNSLHDVRFPLEISVGAQCGPQWQTQIVPLASCHEFRNALHGASRRRWDLTGRVMSLAELDTLTAFFEARMGRFFGFRFQDPIDHSSAAGGADPGELDQEIGVGDGALATFQLVKHYTSADSETVRRITRPAVGSVSVAIDGAQVTDGWALEQGGVVVFDAPPATGAIVSAGFEFDLPARFDMDRLDTALHAPDAARLGPVAIVELLE